jgi:hypothetical protein
MKEELYDEYVIWLKQTYDITPDDKYLGINEFESLKTMRDEILGRRGETQMVKMLMEDGVYEERKKEMENSKWMVLTFEEYKNSKQK